jgi:hypothetical protein
MSALTRAPSRPSLGPPQPSSALKGLVNSELIIAKKVLLLASRILPLFPPPAGGELAAARRLKKVARQSYAPEQDHHHHWIWVDKLYQCVRCGSVSAKKRNPTLNYRCGAHHRLGSIIASPKGHQLIIGDACGLSFLLCSSCGAFGSSKCKALKHPCVGSAARTAAGRRTIEMITGSPGRLPLPRPTGREVTNLWSLQGSRVRCLH